MKKLSYTYKLTIEYIILSLPGIGILLLIASWIFPTLNLFRNIGLWVLFSGWILWSVTTAISCRNKRHGFITVIWILIFFPIVYSVVIVLLPWLERLRRATHDLDLSNKED